jgi:Tfp pilus assembly protein PilZ
MKYTLNADIEELMKGLTVILFSLFCIFSVSAKMQTGSDSIAAVDTALLNIYKQLMVFPQEKIYVQTDKPYYVAGETVFYRLFLLDACFHVPFLMSRYVYVELIDLNNSVEIR